MSVVRNCAVHSWCDTICPTLPVSLSAEDASVEIAVCQLLLGRKIVALGTLGVLDSALDGGDSAPDSGILDFIKV